jgi:hypothetical protein
MFVAVIAHVFNNITPNDLGGQAIGHRDVSHIAAGQLTLDDLIIRGDDKMQFGCHPGAVGAARLIDPLILYH